MSKEEKQSENRLALSAEVIIDAATALIEREGLASFTMRSLGRELGTSAMAVYSHFSSRDEVLCAVLERFMASLNTDPIPGERWDNTLRRTMTSIYREELAHSDLASIEVQSPTGAQGLEQHTNKIVNLHLAQGMPEPILTQAWAMVDAYLTGFAGNAIALKREKVARERGSADLEGQAARGRNPQNQNLGGQTPENATPDDVPLWRRIVAEAYTDEAFAHGVEIIIEGIRGLAAPDPCEWYTPE